MQNDCQDINFWLCAQKHVILSSMTEILIPLLWIVYLYKLILLIRLALLMF